MAQTTNVSCMLTELYEFTMAAAYLKNPEQYPTVLGPGLERLQKDVIHRIMIKELGES